MSSPSSPSAGTPEDWLRHARSDLALARAVEDNPDVLPNPMAEQVVLWVETVLNSPPPTLPGFMLR